MAFLFNLLVFLLPLTFLPLTSELFEFNKIVLVYGFTILIAARWAFECVKHKRIIFRRTSLDVPILLFLFTQIVSTIFSIDTRTSIFGYYGRFHGGLLSYFSYSILYFAYVSFMDSKKTINLIKIILISSIIAALWAAIEHFGYSPSCIVITESFDTNCWVQNVQERVFGTFGQPNWLAAYLVAIIPLAIANTFINKINNFKNTVYIFIPVLLFVTLLFTKSRSGLLGFGLSNIIFLFLTLKTNFRKHAAKFLILNLFFLALFLLFNPLSSDTSINESKQTVASDSLGGTESGEIRKIVWTGAIDLWKRYPFFGTGIETFAYSYYETRPLAHNNTSEWNYLYNKAHNEYLNFSATTGTIGLASYLILIISSIIIFAKNKRSLVNISLAAGYTSILVTNFFGFSTVSIAVLFFLFPAMAISLNISKIKIKKIKYKNPLYLLFIGTMAFYLVGNLARYWLADYYYAKGKIEEAVELSPNEPIYRIERAKVYVELGDATHAEKEINFVKHSSGRNVKLLKEVANIFGDLSEIDNSYLLKEYEQLQDISKLAPTDVQIKYQLALSFGKLGNIEESKQEVLEVINMKPDYKLARKYLANIYISQNEQQKAKEQFEYILKYISPDDREIRNSLDNLEK